MDGIVRGNNKTAREPRRSIFENALMWILYHACAAVSKNWINATQKRISARSPTFRCHFWMLLLRYMQFCALKFCRSSCMTHYVLHQYMDWLKTSCFMCITFVAHVLQIYLSASLRARSRYLAHLFTLINYHESCSLYFNDNFTILKKAFLRADQ